MIYRAIRKNKLYAIVNNFPYLIVDISENTRSYSRLVGLLFFTTEYRFHMRIDRKQTYTEVILRYNMLNTIYTRTMDNHDNSDDTYRDLNSADV